MNATHAHERPARVLVIEDNDDLAFGLRANLEVEGYDVAVAGDGDAALECIASADHDLIILDLMLPGRSGLDVLRQLRADGHETPVLILTARGSEVDKVLGLRLGADDYVTKPFGLLELIARVEVLLRRVRKPTALEQRWTFADVEVIESSRQVLRRGERVSLAPKEYALLVALLKREGKVATRLELMREVWGHSAVVVSRTVDTHIAELRRKLEADPARPRHLLTVRKVGYRLAVP